MRFLTFVLSGALQSWGDEARWDDRSTSVMPTKSAIVGLLGCCLGYARGDDRLRRLSESLHMAVRADQSGRKLWDFHTVQRQGGKILNSMGKPRSDTIITQKQYLQDSRFRVFLWGDEPVLRECEHAMLHPRWVPCLGRRSCPPSVPLVPRVVEYDSIDKALEQCFEERDVVQAAWLPCEIEADTERADLRVIYRMDEAVHSERNEYVERKVYTKMVQRGNVNVHE